MDKSLYTYVFTYINNNKSHIKGIKIKYNKYVYWSAICECSYLRFRAKGLEASDNLVHGRSVLRIGCSTLEAHFYGTQALVQLIAHGCDQMLVEEIQAVLLRLQAFGLDVFEQVLLIILERALGHEAASEHLQQDNAKAIDVHASA